MAASLRVSTCRVCGSIFEAGPKGALPVTCSTEHRRRDEANRMRQYLADYKAKHGERYEDRYKVPKVCPDCGQEFWTKHGATVRCRPCARVAAMAQINTSRSTAKEGRRRARLPVPLPGPVPWWATVTVLPPAHPARQDWTCSTGLLFVSGPCRRCGTPFTVGTGNTAAYCSARCLKNDERDRRRAKTPGDVSDVVRWRVFELDRWRCHICGRLVQKRYRNSPSHPWGPTVDHLIPRAVGGTHVEANLATAHRMCNSRKGAGSANDQLRLAV